MRAKVQLLAGGGKGAAAGAAAGVRARGSHRVRPVRAVPRRASQQEDHGDHRRAALERHHRSQAGELRPALRRDQQATEGTRAAHVHAAGNPPPDRAGGDRRVFPQRPRRRAVGLEAARRELHPARADLVAGDAESDNGREPGYGGHGLHAHGEQRAFDLRHRGQFGVVFGKRRAADGARTRQRKGRRGCRAAVRRLLPQRGPQMTRACL